MPMLRPLAALLAASTAACAAGGHNVPDEAAQSGTRPDSLVAGAAIPATMPFEGTVYPSPPSHRGIAAAAGAHAQDGDAAASPQAPAAADTALPVGGIVPAAPTQQPAAPGAVPTAPQQPALVPAAPDTADEHAGHTP